MPGQLMMTSISSEVLSSAATDVPKSEIRGLAAAGNAWRKINVNDQSMTFGGAEVRRVHDFNDAGAYLAENGGK